MLPFLTVEHFQTLENVELLRKVRSMRATLTNHVQFYQPQFVCGVLHVKGKETLIRASEIFWFIFFCDYCKFPHLFPSVLCRHTLCFLRVIISTVPEGL